MQGQERLSVSDARIRCKREKRGREESKRQEGDITEDLMRFWDNVCLLFPLSHPDNLNLCRMCHNYSSCHCTDCLSLGPAACENCSSGWTIPWHLLNTWMNTGSTGDLCFLILYTSDLFLKVRVIPPFFEVAHISQVLQKKSGIHLVYLFKMLPESNCIEYDTILIRISLWLVLHVCVWSLHALYMDKLGRGHFYIQAVKGLMTNQEKDVKGFSSQLKMKINDDVIWLWLIYLS